MNESPIVLACEDVTLGYEHKPLLEHLTLTVRAGDYLCIVGENGSVDLPLPFSPTMQR